MIWDPLERLLWGFAFALAFICAIIYLNKARKSEVSNEKIIMYGFSGLLFGFLIAQICLYLIDFQIIGTYDNGSFIGDFNNHTPLYEVLGMFFAISYAIGFILFILAFEITFKHTKYIFTILYTVLLVIMITGFNETSFILFVVALLYAGAGFIITFILYLYTKWSRLEFKAISSFLMFSINLFLQAMGIGGRDSKEFNVMPLIVGPILFISGSLMTILPTIINPEVISRSLKYPTIFGILSLALTIGFSSIGYIYNLDMIILYLITIGFGIVMVVLVLLNIKSEINADDKELIKEKRIEIFEIVAKPRKVTEEEVTVSKEKKICLVCKGKLGRDIYLCPDCNAFYCNNCSKTLVDMENACWVCEAPFDESKPVKLQEKKEEKLEKISQKRKKKN